MSLSIFFLCYFVLLWWFSRRQTRQAIWNLKHLGEDEKIVLGEYLKQNKSVAYFTIENGVVSCLIAKGILIHASSYFPCDSVPVAIHPYIIQFLKKNPNLVGLKPEEIGNEKPAERAAGRYPKRELSQP